MTDFNLNNYVMVAKIVATKGLKGEVKIKSFTEDMESIVDYKMYDSLLNEYIITDYYIKESIIICKINGCNTIEDAQKIVNTDLYILKKSLPKLDNDTFYYVDLVGLDVIDDATKVNLGVVRGVYNFGAGDLIEIQMVDSSLKLISFNKDNIINVDLKNKKINVLLPQEITPQLKDSNVI